MRRFLLVIAVLAITLPAWSQDASTDSQTLRAILDEVQHLRRDLQTTSAAAQRVQITLYRLQLQDAAVAHARKLAEEAHSKLAANAAERTRVAAGIDRAARALDAGTNENDRKAVEQALPELKRHLEQLSKDEEPLQAKVSEADDQVTTEETRLTRLHNLLDQLDQALQNLGRTREDTPRR